MISPSVISRGMPKLVLLVLLGMNVIVFTYGSVQQFAEKYNLALVCIVTLSGILLFLGTFGNESNRQGCSRSTMALLFLVPTIIEAAQIVKNTDFKFLRMWHTYYTVTAAESVTVQGTLNPVFQIFENFGSAFATPLLLSMVSIVTELDILTGFNFYGLVTFGGVIMPALWLLSRRVGARDCQIVTLSAILALMRAEFMTKYFVYSVVNWALVILLLYIFVVFVNRSQGFGGRSAIPVLTVITVGGLIHYPPGSLLLTIIALALCCVIVILLRKQRYESKLRSLRYTRLVVVITAFYMIYFGFYFYDDILLYLAFVVRSFKIEPYIVYSVPRLQQLDEISKLVVQATRLGNLLTLLYLVGFVHMFRKGPITRALALVGIFIVGSSYSGVFVHGITDYSYRLYQYSVPFGTIFLYWAIKDIRSWKRARRLFASAFLLLVIVTSLFMVVQSLMTPPFPRWVSEKTYFMEEAFVSSSFARDRLDWERPRLVFANERYGYLRSVWGRTLYDFTNASLTRFMNHGDSVLVLSPLNFLLSERYRARLTLDDYRLLTAPGTDLIYNSNLTWVLIR